LPLGPATACNTQPNPHQQPQTHTHTQSCQPPKHSHSTSTWCSRCTANELGRRGDAIQRPFRPHVAQTQSRCTHPPLQPTAIKPPGHTHHGTRRSTRAGKRQQEVRIPCELLCPKRSGVAVLGIVFPLLHPHARARTRQKKDTVSPSGLSSNSLSRPSTASEYPTAYNSLRT